MRRSAAGVALALAVLATACGRGGNGLNASRESAYQANNLGVALLEQFKYEEAAAEFRRAISIEPALGIAHVNLGIALLSIQDLAGAAREATEGQRLLASAPQPPYLLGLVARAENRDQEAVRFFQRVLQIDPRDVGASVNLAQLNLQDRRYAEAIALLRSAVADEPYNITAAYSLGLALTRDGQREEGQRFLERSQALRTTGYGTTYGNQYLEQGRYAEAIASTGAEPDLVDTSVPSAKLSAVAVGTVVPGATPAASPFGGSFAPGELTPGRARALAASLGGGVTLSDFDLDGDLDVFVAAPAGQGLLRNDGQGAFADVTTGSGLGEMPADSVPIGAVSGDYDNDGAPDLFVLRYGRSSLYHNDGGGRFTDVTTRAGLPVYPHLPGAAALVDVDHDGDLDLVIAGLADLAETGRRPTNAPLLFPRQFAPAPPLLCRNNGNGTFTDVTRDAGLRVATHAIAIVPTDFDNRRDIDLLFVNRDAPPMLFKNLRDGTFRDVSADVGLGSALGPNEEITAVAAADINKDDYPDFFLARPSGGLFALSDSRGRFTLAPAPAGAQAAAASQFIDYDNDGLLDLLTWSADAPRMFRNQGQRWVDVSASALSGPGASTGGRSVSERGLAAADLNGDGNVDFMTLGAGGLLEWRNSGEPRYRSLRVQLKGRVSNRLGLGSKVQLRAGSLRQRLEVSATTPAVAPADVVFGVGPRAGAEVVRVLWPSGILQAETAAGIQGSPAAQVLLPSPLVVEELDRKPSSCPFLFTWNGERFEFVTDFMGGGEMGAWAGPGKRNRPDPLEYVRIRGDQLRPKDGRFEIRVTNELEETLYADRLQLLAVSHPADVDVFPNEGLTDPPKPFRLFAVRDKRVPTRVVDEHGHDVTSRLAAIDRQYPDDFKVGPVRGYSADHALTLDLGPGTDVPTDRGGGPAPTVLLLTAWTDYAFSSDNLAAYQAGLSLKAPSLQIKDVAGSWRTAFEDIGIPVGRPQTIVVDLSRHLRRGEHEVRISTNMRIYWDQMLVARSVATGLLKTTRIDPGTATLRSRGFSAEVRQGGKGPITYDYQRVSVESPWKAMPGRYTREGDVRRLLTQSDDMFVIAKPGDELTLSFAATEDGSLPAGWTRTFLLLADGFSKEMDINSGSPDEVEPLPFHDMTTYPYSAPEQYPDTPAYTRYRERYNTRPVVKSLPSLDTLKTKD